MAENEMSIQYILESGKLPEDLRRRIELAMYDQSCSEFCESVIMLCDEVLSERMNPYHVGKRDQWEVESLCECMREIMMCGAIRESSKLFDEASAERGRQKTRPWRKSKKYSRDNAGTLHYQRARRIADYWDATTVRSRFERVGKRVEHEAMRIEEYECEIFDDVCDWLPARSWSFDCDVEYQRDGGILVLSQDDEFTPTLQDLEVMMGDRLTESQILQYFFSAELKKYFSVNIAERIVSAFGGYYYAEEWLCETESFFTDLADRCAHLARFNGMSRAYKVWRNERYKWLCNLLYSDYTWVRRENAEEIIQNITVAFQNACEDQRYYMP